MSNTQAYRNLEDITSDQGTIIESESLWELEEPGTLVLCDDDQYVTHSLDLTLFYLI